MTLVFDAGAFVAAERGDRQVMALLKAELLAGRTPVTHGGVVGQIWRGGQGRQVPVARLLDGVEVVPLDDELGRQAGVLLRHTGGRDVIDAAVVLLARDGDTILTSDPGDLASLAAEADIHLELANV
ncbi:PIN domain-containing protein [Kribbella sp. GL6]|uniref:PIN domain-containing protein n=1 Tax=Kribbella sp. GL6 TaxID=3419765 RepID=UPI003CFCF568